MRYRADIDGLRAVAVLPVVAFHAGIGRFRGGFVGVDVFFVISGYLISSLILADVERGAFSVRSFYERRIRRIFPALAATLLCTSLLSYRYLLPTELASFSQSLLAAALSAGNIFFWRHSGYFNAGNETAPLLHTWSLAVEEQFYLLLPLFLLAAQRWFKQRVRAGILVLACLSLAVSTVESLRAPATAFYLLHSRAWELLLGTILALGVLPELRRGARSEAATAIGAGMVLTAVFTFSAATPFPGLAALLPCVGAALIIHVGRTTTTLTSRVLSKRPFVFVGLVSYSLYLWHWPLIVFQRTGAILSWGVSSAAGKIVVVIASLVAAILSWWLIERPFRKAPGAGRASHESSAPTATTKSHDGTPRRRISPLVAGGIVTAVTAAVAISGIASHGFPQRFSEEEVRLASYLGVDDAPFFRGGTCFLLDDADELNDACLGKVDGRRNYLLVGDSYAADLWFGLKDAFPEVNFLQATAAGCTPTLSEAASTDPRHHRCTKLLKHVFFDFLEKQKVDALVVAGSWREGDLPAVSDTLEWAAAHRIRTILFGPKLHYDADLPRILVSALRSGDPGLPDRHRIKTYDALDRTMAAIASDKHAEYVSYFNLLCKGESCQHTDDAGRPLAFDSAHLTRFGSLVVARRLRSSGIDVVGKEASP